MNIKEMRKRLDAVRDGLRYLTGLDELEGAQPSEFDWLEAEDRWLTGQLEAAERREERRRELAASLDNPSSTVTEVPGEDRGAPNVNTQGKDPYDLSGLRTMSYGQRDREIRARTLTVIEDDGRFVEDVHRANATKVVERLGHKPHVAESILLRCSELYRDAFFKKLYGRDLSDAERAVLAEAHDVYSRALALSDVTGVLVPAQLDTTVIISNDGTFNPFRRISRVETGTTNVFTGVTSAGVTASWDAEAAEVSDDAPSFSNPPTTAYKGSAFIPISYEAFEDAVGREDEIVAMIVDGKDRLESTAFATGNGTSAPRGIVTALDANTNVEVETTTSNVFGLVDVYNLYEQLPARWRPRATWAANLTIINDIRQFGTDNYNTQTVQLGAETVPAVLGRPVVESSEMDGTIAAGGEDNILVVGDFQQYLIYDRLGLSVEFIPNLFGTTNGRPTGQRGWMAHFRTGANTQVDTAFRLLQAHTNS